MQSHFLGITNQKCQPKSSNSIDLEPQIICIEMQFNRILSFVAVGFLWGVTNPLIKRGSAGIQANAKTTNNKLYQIVLDVKFLVLRWQYIVPFLLNQSGSLLYVLALQDSEISLAVPIAQSCTFLFTTITAICLRERMPNKLSLFGIALMAIGINICIFSKM